MTAADLLYGADPSQAILATVAAWRAHERTGDCDYEETRERLLGRLRTLQDRKDGV